MKHVLVELVVHLNCNCVVVGSNHLTQFWVFPMNRLATEVDPLGDTYCVAQLSLIFWCFSGVMMFRVDFYCT